MELVLAKIKELPVLERPREKAIRYGLDNLSNEELLAILIRTGTKDTSALDIAHHLYSESRGLSNLFLTTYRALLDNKGIGPGKALILSSCFELCNRYLNSLYGESVITSSLDIYNHYSLKMRKSNNEIFKLIILNRRRAIVHEENLYVGSESHISCQPTEIIKKIILHNGVYFYMIHNHPSGNSTPSKEDVDLTTEVMRLCPRVNVTMLDHLIIGDDDFYSFHKHEKVTSNLN